MLEGRDVILMMKKIKCTTKSGETFFLYRIRNKFCCPVCGNSDFKTPPYQEDGTPSFETCNCKFKFGFDDDPGACRDAIAGIQENWKRWRKNLIKEASESASTLTELESQLKNIKVYLAFDLIAVQDESYFSE